MAVATILYPTQNPGRVYRGVPTLRSATEAFEKEDGTDLISRLGTLFVKHNVWDKFAVCLVHKHFSLGENEILVEGRSKERDRSTVSLPWVVFEGGNKARPSPNEVDVWNGYGLADGDFIIPTSWTFGMLGNLESFEYAVTNAVDLYQEPCPAFASAFWETAKEAGLENVIGLKAAPPGVSSTLERTLGNHRVNITSPILEDGGIRDAVRVTWRFTAEGGLSDGAEWCDSSSTQNFISH